MGTWRSLLVAAMAGSAVVAAAGPAPAAGDGIRRVSVSDSGAQGNGSSAVVGLSADGRYVAFGSDATNLVPGDTNGAWDTFVRDLRAGTTVRVSVSSTGAQANGASFDAAFSANGRYVAFGSDATNLVPGDTNGKWDTFVRDLRAGTTVRVSVSSAGAQANGRSYATAISADGRYVAFTSDATNLVPGDTNGAEDVFVRDLRTGTTRRISLSSAGAAGDDRSVSYGTVFGAHGRYVVFTSDASNLVPDDTNHISDVFVRDLRTGTTRRVSLTSTGAQADGGSANPAISADGRYVAFDSNASNLVPGGAGTLGGVFVRDLRAGTTIRVSVSSTGVPALTAGNPVISGNGRYVAFVSVATDLVPGDTNDTGDVFVRDLRGGTTRRVSVSGSGAEGDGFSYGPTISPNGRYLAFTSYASNLVRGDTNGTWDAFFLVP